MPWHGSTSGTRDEMGEVPPPAGDWYRDLAGHLGSAYLRYSFTQGTAQEVDFLFDLLRLKQGDRLLDVGCGPGRHSIEFAKRGVDVVGIDLSPEFISVARAGAKREEVDVAFFEMNALDMPFDEEFNAVVSICEGAFSLGLDDLAILKAMTRAARPGAGLAVAAVNVFYVLAHMAESGNFDPATMLFCESEAPVIGEDGTTKAFSMWNSCYTPRELTWIANGAGLDPQVVYGVVPGAYSQQAASFDHPELLLIAKKPPSE